MKMISINGVDFIKKFEGCSLSAYWDVDGYSIGYGHHKNVNKDDKITKEHAQLLLVQDLWGYVNAVNMYDAKYHFTQNEFDALVSFAYNCGVGNLKNLTKNGTRTKEQIAGKILEYNKAGGKVNAGLTKRRKAEHDLFVKGV